MATLIDRYKCQERIWLFADRLVDWGFPKEAEAVRAVAKGIKLEKTVDAVEAEKYNDLREAFVDYVCSGIPNPAPYCGNRCKECVDGRGWCKEDPASCKGFNPDGERRTDGN